MADTLNFSIESTTLRLKSLKQRRAEEADRELDAKLRTTSRDSLDMPTPRDRGPAGRVRHDERGMAVWDMAVASGEFAKLSATNVMRKLNIDDLAIAQTQRSLKAVVEPSARDAGGGGDPYNQRKDAGHPSQQFSRSGGNPYDFGASGDPYNQRATPKRPAPDKPGVKASAGSVLDQLTGKKK
jgi:hypothetical protein